MPPEVRLLAAWRIEHALIATTMLVVGLFAVLSWDSAFPSRRDVLVLSPLPVETRTLLLAKMAALAASLGLAVVTLNCASGLTWPLVLAPANSGVPGVVRSLAAYWITMTAAGAFIVCSALGLQGVAAQLLPRRLFLRVSAILQMAAFCVLVSVYALQPAPSSPNGFSGWLPSHWFLGLFQQLSGSMPPSLAPFAHRAWAGLAVAGIAAGASFLLCYLRTLRQIVEEPDIAPAHRGWNWLPRFGSSTTTAIVQFSTRTLLRSRQHRLILAFYWGIGFAIVILFRRSSPPGLSPMVLIAGIVFLSTALMGTRVVFSVPLDLRANWVFRILPLGGGQEYVTASRRALLVLAVMPVWLISAALILSMSPWHVALARLFLLGLVGLILTEICLSGFHKVPFTCSYLPGKSRIHMAVWGYIWLVLLLDNGARLELWALQQPTRYAVILAILGGVLVLLRWHTAVVSRTPDAVLQFEAEPDDGIISLGLHRDGVLPISG